MGKIAYVFCCLILLIGCSDPKNKVYCPKCHKSLIKENVFCPKENAPLNGYKYWFWSRGRNLPVMAYNAETYLLKDKNGKFYWYPEEVDLHDFDK